MTSFKDKLQETKVSKVSVKKTSVPILTNVPDEITKAAIDFLAKNKKKKELETELAALNSQIAEYTQEIQDSRAFKGDFNNSYKIPAGDAEVMVTTKNVFSINSEDESKIKKLFGKQFDSLIKEKLEVVLKDEVFENENLQNELMELMDDDFSKFFNTFTTLKVQEDYDEKIYLFAKTQVNLDNIRILIKPSKSAIK